MCAIYNPIWVSVWYSCVCNITGPLTIVDLQDVTTQSDLNNEKAVFALDIHPPLSLNVTLGYSVQIQWRQNAIEFGSSHRIHTYSLPPEGTRNCRRARSTSLELVRAGFYELSVPTTTFDSGPLSISVSISLFCLQLTSDYCPRCSQWRYTTQANSSSTSQTNSSSIDISAKRGRTTHTLQLHELWLNSVWANNVVHKLRTITL